MRTNWLWWVWVNLFDFRNPKCSHTLKRRSNHNWKNANESICVNVNLFPFVWKVFGSCSVCNFKQQILLLLKALQFNFGGCQSEFRTDYVYLFLYSNFSVYFVQWLWPYLSRKELVRNSFECEKGFFFKKKTIFFQRNNEWELFCWNPFPWEGYSYRHKQRCGSLRVLQMTCGFLEPKLKLSCLLFPLSLGNYQILLASVQPKTW